MPKYHLYALLLFVFFSVSAIFLVVRFNMSASLPWVPTGRMAILVHTVPTPNAIDELRLGIDDMRLYRDDGSEERVTVVSRRATFSPKDTDLYLLIDAEVPEGTYTALSFTIKSPELRNPWQQDEPARHITLLEEHVYMRVNYQVTQDSTTALLLGLETQRGLFVVDDTLMFLPVLHVETRHSTNLNPSQDGSTATVSGGTISTNATYGMDWDGQMKFNFRPKAKEVIQNEPTTQPQVEPEITNGIQPTEVEIESSTSTTATTTEALYSETSDAM